MEKKQKKRRSPAEVMSDRWSRLTPTQQAEFCLRHGLLRVLDVETSLQERESIPGYHPVRRLNEPHPGRHIAIWLAAYGLDGGDAFLAQIGGSWLSKPDEIKSLVRKAMLRLHPDHGGDPAVFRQFLAAWKRLKPYFERASYGEPLEKK